MRGFVATLLYFYSTGEQQSEQFKKYKNIIMTMVKQDERYPKIAQQILEILTQRKDNSGQIQSLDLGSVTMKQEFGIETRIWMLEYIKDLKRKLKEKNM